MSAPGDRRQAPARRPAPARHPVPVRRPVHGNEPAPSREPAQPGDRGEPVLTGRPVPPGERQPSRAAARQPVALVDLLDRVLAGGVVISGEVRLAIADVDMVSVSLQALISSVGTAFGSGPGEDETGG